MRVKVGVFPCTFKADQPHPVATVEGRRVARFRRNLEGGIRYNQARGSQIHYVVVAMRYDVITGQLKGNLRYSTQRFIQLLRRKGLDLEYIRVIEPTGAGVKNHSNLVLAVRGGEFPSKHELKDVWVKATRGTSYELETSKVKDVGSLARYLSKFLGGYLSKTLQPNTDPNAESSPDGAPQRDGGLDTGYQTTTGKRVSEYVTTSRGWLPVGAQVEWKRLFKEFAFFWKCDRAFFHTNMGETAPRWLNWLDRQGWALQ